MMPCIRCLLTTEAIARELLPIVEAEPTLRYGSYAGGIEEMVEACVFRTFLVEDRYIMARIGNMHYAVRWDTCTQSMTLFALLGCCLCCWLDLL